MAYFMALPELAGEFPKGRVAMSMKRFLQESARQRVPADQILPKEDQDDPENTIKPDWYPVPDEVKVIYNLAREHCAKK